MYTCEGLNGIDRSRVRGVDDAARVFAHRLAAKMFGRSGRMLSLQRIRSGPRWVQYEAQLGRLTGPSTYAMLLVTER